MTTRKTHTFSQPLGSWILKYVCLNSKPWLLNSHSKEWSMVMVGDWKCVFVGVGEQVVLQGDKRENRGTVRAWKWMKSNDDEGDWGQEVSCSKEGKIYEDKNVCVCVCVYMSDSVVLGHLDCLIHTPTHTSLFFPHLTSSPSTCCLPKPCLSFPNLSPWAFSNSTTSFHSPHVNFRFDPGTIPPCGSHGTFPIRPWY